MNLNIPLFPFSVLFCTNMLRSMCFRVKYYQRRWQNNIESLCENNKTGKPIKLKKRMRWIKLRRRKKTMKFSLRKKTNPRMIKLTNFVEKNAAFPEEIIINHVKNWVKYSSCFSAKRSLLLLFGITDCFCCTKTLIWFCGRRNKKK